MKNKTIITLFIITLVACKDKDFIKTQESFKLTETISKEKELVKVITDTVKSELLLTGKITFDEDKVAKVFPLAGGFVKELTVELGDYVQKGQIMAIIRSPEIAGFTREGIEAEAHKKSAEKRAKIAEELYKSGIISEVEFLESKKELETTSGESRRIQDVLDMYSASEGALYPIKAPVSGVVIQKNIALNMELRTEDITPAFVVGSIEDVWVMLNVYESDVAKIKEGYDAEITTISYPDKVFKGKIDKLFSLMDAESKTLKARVTLKNEDFILKPEMFANVRVLYNETEMKKSIPSKALIFDKSRYYVMVYKSDENIETREVQVFKENGSTAYIESGLKENEQIIVKHQLLVYDALND